MSSDNEWEDEEQDEGEDFVPDEYDEDDDDEYDEEEDEDPEDDIPTFLHGEIIIDSTSNKNVKFVGSNFCLVCQTPTFAIGTPSIGKYLFVGWVVDPGIGLEFVVYFSKQPLSTVDPLEMKLLEAQEKEFLVAGIDENKEISSGEKIGNDSIDDKWMNDKKSSGKNLKAPPMYSLIKKGDAVKDTTECAGNNAEKSTFKKSPAMKSDEAKTPGDFVDAGAGEMTPVKHPNSKVARDDSVFVVSGTQIGSNEKGNKNITFRGSYRCPSENSCERIHLICSVQAIDGAASGTAMTSGAAACGVAVSASKKRNRVDDDSVGDGDVAYQELIDLHDDTRLSTEDLRKKYYGSEDRKGKDTKKRASKGTYGTSSNNGDDDDDNDNEDDAYGF